MGWLSSALSLASSVAKGVLVLIGWRKQVSDEDTGRALQRSDDGTALTKETQAVADARNTPTIVDGVQQQSYRD